MDPIDLNDIYREMPLNDIPWNLENPPPELTGLVDDGTLKPCRAVDLGCGTGNYTRYLASKGFDVTGIDFAPEAIRIATGRAQQEGIPCRFICADLCGDLPASLHGQFGFAFEWEVLHHIYPEQREAWIRNVHRLLAPGGIYFAVCFHEQDDVFGLEGKYRKTRIGTILYFSNEDELRALYAPWFSILELKMTRSRDKTGGHLVNYALLRNTYPKIPGQ